MPTSSSLKRNQDESFTSNVFAILGLRSLYFAPAGMIDKFCFLKLALPIVLIVVGTTI